jgi:ADP-heptose:LPS heptosyltransferase
MRLATKQRLDYVLGGVGIFVLRPLTVVLGHLLGRDHSLTVKDKVAFIKMLGGGSLVIALPALLGFRRKHADARLILVTTNAVKAFADAIGVFDEVMLIDDRSLAGLLKSGARVLRKLFRIDTIIDLEIYSRLTTVLATMSCARNRVGFYLENTFWREHMATHLVFFNRFAGSFHFYEAVVTAFGADPADLTECGKHVARANGIEVYPSPAGGRVTVHSAPGRVCIAPACSELGHERMLNESQWARVLPKVVGNAEEVVVLGGPSDGAAANAVISQGRRVLPELDWVNACDGRTLRDSLHVLAGCSRLIAIDSSILHFGRLFGIPTVSFWGPTDPMTRLKEVSLAGEAVWYEKVLCSPCVHVAETPPCSGRNLCIEAAVRRCCGEEVDSIAKASYLLPFTEIKRRKSRGETC